MDAETYHADGNRAVRLLIVDQHKGVREAVAQRLDRRADAQVLGAVGSVDRAMQLIAANKPDLVLYEPKGMVKHDPGELTALVAAGSPVVVWTSSLVANEAEMYKSDGAAAVLLKAGSIARLVAALAWVKV